MNDRNAPPIPPAVVEYLERVYPAAWMPSLNTTDREVWLHFGHRQVVEHLRNLIREQEESPQEM